MKNTKIITLIMFITLFLFACDDLLDVEESFTFSKEFVIDTEEHAFDQAELFDLAADVSIIDEYGSKIKEVKIEEVRFWLTAHNGDAGQQFESGSLSVSDTDNGSVREIASLGGYNLQNLLNSPTVLDLNNSGVNLLGELAEEPPHRFMLHANATFNEGPLDFTVKFEFTARMVANPLN